MKGPKDGGLAFGGVRNEPVTSALGANQVAAVTYPGMSLRDFFAAKAMQGLIASNDEGAGDRLSEIPGYAYDIADAMLKVRGNGVR